MHEALHAAIELSSIFLELLEDLLEVSGLVHRFHLVKCFRFLTSEGWYSEVWVWSSENYCILRHIIYINSMVKHTVDCEHFLIRLICKVALCWLLECFTCVSILLLCWWSLLKVWWVIFLVWSFIQVDHQTCLPTLLWVTALSSIWGHLLLLDFLGRNDLRVLIHLLLLR